MMSIDSLLDSELLKRAGSWEVPILKGSVGQKDGYSDDNRYSCWEKSVREPSMRLF